MRCTHYVVPGVRIPHSPPMSEHSHHIIDLSRLPVGTHHFEIQLDDDFFGSLEKSEILRGCVTAQIALKLREEDYQLSISVRGTVCVVCDRCLDPMNIEINANDVIVECVDGTEPDKSLDLSWLAYEIVSINIPLVHSHQPGECNKQMELLLHDHLCDEPEPEE